MKDHMNNQAENTMQSTASYRQTGGKKKPILKFIMVTLCATAMMLGSGYVGARIARDGTTEISTEAVVVIPANAPDSNIGLLANVATPRSELTLPELFEGANPAVVAISTEIIGRNAFGHMINRPSAGSGFLVSPDGYIVTNDHVIENANSITVLLYDGRELPARVVGRDPDSDIAVIKIEGANFPHLTFGDSDTIRVGEQVAAIGNPLGELANSMTVGYISALNRDIKIDGSSHNKIQTDAAVNRGNSGGPLLNLRGEVIGVVSAKSTGMDVEGLGFAIPASQAESVVRQLVEYGFVRGRAILGVNIQHSAGIVQVASVNPGSAAERAGLLAGDIILTANGAQISSFADLRAILDELSPGDIMELRLRRGSEEISLTAQLDEYKPAGL